jgi:hypothetical protein
MSIRRLIHIEEPLLEFRFGQKLVYPRDGLFLYGPVDGGRPLINYGAIGTPAGLNRLERWIQAVCGFIPAPSPSAILCSLPRKPANPDSRSNSIFSGIHCDLTTVTQTRKPAATRVALH